MMLRRKPGLVLKGVLLYAHNLGCGVLSSGQPLYVPVLDFLSFNLLSMET